MAKFAQVSLCGNDIVGCLFHPLQGNNGRIDKTCPNQSVKQGIRQGLLN